MSGIDIRECRVRPNIGARWTPEHVVRQDTSSGFYEELNAPSSRMSEDALELQSALLYEPARTERLFGVILATVMGIVGAAALFHWWSS